MQNIMAHTTARGGGGGASSSSGANHNNLSIVRESPSPSHFDEGQESRDAADERRNTNNSRFVFGEKRSVSAPLTVPQFAATTHDSAMTAESRRQYGSQVRGSEEEKRIAEHTERMQRHSSMSARQRDSFTTGDSAPNSPTDQQQKKEAKRSDPPAKEKKRAWAAWFERIFSRTASHKKAKERQMVDRSSSSKNVVWFRRGKRTSKSSEASGASCVANQSTETTADQQHDDNSSSNNNTNASSSAMLGEEEITATTATTSTMMQAYVNMLFHHMPLFQFLFDREGKLLVANPSAKSYYGNKFTLRALIEDSTTSYSDARSREEQYEKLLYAIRHGKHYTFQQKRWSKRDPTVEKWVEIEVWPMRVKKKHIAQLGQGIGGEDALQQEEDDENSTTTYVAIVNQTNITKLKDVEWKLLKAQLELQRLNTQLERSLVQAEKDLRHAGLSKPFEWSAAQNQQDEGEHDRPSFSSIKPRISINTDTPLDMTLRLLDGLLAHELPERSRVKDLRRILIHTSDFRSPLSLRHQLQGLGPLSTLADGGASSVFDETSAGNGDDDHDDHDGNKEQQRDEQQQEENNDGGDDDAPHPSSRRASIDTTRAALLPSPSSQENPLPYDADVAGALVSLLEEKREERRTYQARSVNWRASSTGGSSRNHRGTIPPAFLRRRGGETGMEDTASTSYHPGDSSTRSSYQADSTRSWMSSSRTIAGSDAGSSSLRSLPENNEENMPTGQLQSTIRRAMTKWRRRALGNRPSPLSSSTPSASSTNPPRAAAADVGDEKNDAVSFDSFQREACKVPDSTVRAVVHDLIKLANHQRLRDSVALTSHEMLDTPALRVLPPQVGEILQLAMNSWTFDAFRWKDAARMRPLSLITFYTMEYNELLTYLDIHRVRFMRFLLAIEDGYPEDNPYHNRTHASEVVRVINLLFVKGGILDDAEDDEVLSSAASLGEPERQLSVGIDDTDHAPTTTRRNDSVSSTSFLPPPPPSSLNSSRFIVGTRGCHRGCRRFNVGPLEYFAALYSALVHDHEHIGRNNEYLVRTRHRYATMYNDASPNEAHHIASSFHVMRSTGCKNGAAEENRRGCHDHLPMHTPVLEEEGTDVSSDEGTTDSDDDDDNNNSIRHNGGRPGDCDRWFSRDFLCRMSPEDFRRFRENAISMVLATDMTSHFSIVSEFQRLVPSVPSVGDHSREEVDKSTIDILLKTALKISDIGHLTATLDVHKKWVSRLEEEFFEQGDCERARGMKVSFLMDRSKPGVSKSQVGFFDIVVFPLFKAWVDVFPASEPLLEHVTENYEYWRSRESPPADDVSKSP